MELPPGGERYPACSVPLEEHGVGRGDTVAQLAGNHPETWLVMAAAYTAGRRSVTLHPAGSTLDHINILHDAEARVLVVDDAHRHVIPEVREALPHTTVLTHGRAGPDASSLWADLAPADEASQ